MYNKHKIFTSPNFLLIYPY